VVRRYRNAQESFLLICLLLAPFVASAKDKHKKNYDTCPARRVPLAASRLYPVSPSCRYYWESTVKDGSDRVTAAFEDASTIAVFPPVAATCETLERAIGEKESITPTGRPEWASEGGNSRWHRARSDMIRGCIESSRGSFMVIFNDDRIWIPGPMVGAIVDEILGKDAWQCL